MRWQRRPDCAETAVDDDLFLVNPQTQEIVHLDPLAAALWRLLAAPQGRATIDAVFADAFPDAPPDRLAGDLAEALDTLREAGLIFTVDDGGRGP